MTCSLETKFALLTRGMELEPDEPSAVPEPPRPLGGWPIFYAAARGKRIPLLKVLQSSFCERNCFYCPFRSGRDFPRTALRSRELAQAALALHRRGVIQGVFVSSGITGGSLATQDRLLDTLRYLQDLRFPGYTHLKLMPGADREQVAQAVALAHRVSVNLEAPSARFLSRLAPQKWYWKELLQTLRYAAEARRERLQKGLPAASITTQFVVGPAGETDRDLLQVTQQLVREMDVQRVYYSPFRPVPQTPLEDRAPESPLRVHRLYQAFFLLRDYGFSWEELPLDARGNLPREVDPKVAWAQRHLAHAPVEVNTAEPRELLRVPGIGPQTMRRILRARRERRLRDLRQLQALGVNVRRAAPFVLLDGKRPAVQPSLPLEESTSQDLYAPSSFWEDGESARPGAFRCAMVASTAPMK